MLGAPHLSRNLAGPAIVQSRMIEVILEFPPSAGDLAMSVIVQLGASGSTAV